MVLNNLSIDEEPEDRDRILIVDASKGLYQNMIGGVFVPRTNV